MKQRSMFTISSPRFTTVNNLSLLWSYDQKQFLLDSNSVDNWQNYSSNDSQRGPYAARAAAGLKTCTGPLRPPSKPPTQDVTGRRRKTCLLMIFLHRRKRVKKNCSVLMMRFLRCFVSSVYVRRNNEKNLFFML